LPFIGSNLTAVFAPLSTQIRLTFLYPGAVGRNFGEVLRAIDALQVNWKHKVNTPANWQPGERVVVPPRISDEDAKGKLGMDVRAEDMPSGRKYLRWAPSLGEPEG
jgi:hypothetical protein